MNGIYELRRDWGWLLALGCLSILVGMIAIAFSVAATLVSVIFLGWMLIIGGVVEGMHAMQHRTHRPHLFWYLLEAILGVVVGVLLLRSPEEGAVVITLLLATYFVMAGIFRIVAALMLRFPSWGWTLINGIITLALGVLVWGGWPASGMWVLGVFIGVNLIFRGWARVMLALALRVAPLEHATAS